MKKWSKLIPALAVMAAFAVHGSVDAQTSLSSPRGWYDWSWSPDQTSHRGVVSRDSDDGIWENYVYDGSLVLMLGSRSTESDPPPSTNPGPTVVTGTTEVNHTESNEDEEEEEYEEESSGTLSGEGSWEDGEYLTVAEPSTLLLLTFGFLGLGFTVLTRGRPLRSEND